MSTEALTIVDFHAHYAGRQWPAVAQGGRSATSQWLATQARIADRGDLVGALDRTGIDARVLGAPPGLVRAAPGPLADSTVRGLNTHLAEVVATHPERLYGLATIDAFAEGAAANVDYAINELGLHGIVVDVATDDLGPQLLLDAEQARPALAAAARLGVPVFAHPLSPTQLTARLFDSAGQGGIGLARGTITCASLLALAGSGALDELPDLHIVFPWLGGATGLLQLAAGHSSPKLFRAAPEGERWHIYLDIMGLDPNWIAYAVVSVGADHVLMGSDWPIRPRYVTRAEVQSALSEAGIPDDERRLVAGENALRLLSRSRHPSVTERAPAVALDSSGVR